MCVCVCVCVCPHLSASCYGVLGDALADALWEQLQLSKVKHTSMERYPCRIRRVHTFCTKWFSASWVFLYIFEKILSYRILMLTTQDGVNACPMPCPVCTIYACTWGGQATGEREREPCGVGLMYARRHELVIGVCWLHSERVWGQVSEPAKYYVNICSLYNWIRIYFNQ